MIHKSTMSQESRTGVILVPVLVGFLVVTLVSAALVEAIVLQHRQTRRSEQRQQALWLAESAVQRALHASAESPDYQGETWRVSAEVLGADCPGLAIIEVESVTQPDAGRRIRVQSSYPAETVYRISLEREVFVTLAKSNESTSDE